MAIFTHSSEDAYRELAREIADDRNEVVVSSVTDIPLDETTLYVGSPDDISETKIVQIQSDIYDRYAQTHDHETLGFSITTGRTPSEAKALYEREHSARDHHCIHARGLSKQYEFKDDRTTLLAERAATVEGLDSILEDGIYSLSTLWTARSIHAHFDDGYLCGFPSDPEDWDFDGTFPPCVTDGERDCPREGQLLQADQVEIPEIFLNGCTSVINNNFEDPPLHLGLGLLSRAMSIISPFQVIDALPHQTVLYHDLLRSGYDASERTYLLNKSATVNAVEAYPYSLYGQPYTRIDTPAETEYSSEREFDDGRYLLRFEDVDTHVIDITIEDDRFDDDQDLFYVRETTGAIDRTLYYTAFREGDRIRVLIYAWGAIQQSELRFELSDTSVKDETDVGELLRKLDGYVRAGLIGGKAKGHIKNARHHFVGGSEYYSRERYNTMAHRELRKRAERTAEGLERAKDVIIENIPESSHPFIDLDDEYTKEVDIWSNACPHCGRDLFVKRIANSLGDVARARAKCPKCSYLFDVPDSDSNPVYPKFVGVDDLLKHDASGSLGLQFENPHDRSIEATYLVTPGLQGNADQEFQDLIFEPREQTVELDPSEERTVRFDYDTTEIDAYRQLGEYYIEGHVITGSFERYMTNGTLFVRDR